MFQNPLKSQASWCSLPHSCVSSHGKRRTIQIDGWLRWIYVIHWMLAVCFGYAVAESCSWQGGGEHQIQVKRRHQNVNVDAQRHALRLKSLNCQRCRRNLSVCSLFGSTYTSLKVDDDPKSLSLNSHYVCPFHLQSTSYFWMNWNNQSFCESQLFQPATWHLTLCLDAMEITFCQEPRHFFGQWLNPDSFSVLSINGSMGRWWADLVVALNFLLYFCGFIQNRSSPFFTFSPLTLKLTSHF